METEGTIIAVRLSYSEPSEPYVNVLHQTDFRNPFAGSEISAYKPNLVLRGTVIFRENIVDFEPCGDDYFYIIKQASLRLYMVILDFDEVQLKPFLIQI